mmetsp:Transcript_84487/g.136934  ORF Transcript_84487/g.136934 Transcript_84487/m.136934 type:complete len:841 (+) Transcript_84487:36-2558(+)
MTQLSIPADSIDNFAVRLSVAIEQLVGSHKCSIRRFILCELFDQLVVLHPSSGHIGVTCRKLCLDIGVELETRLAPQTIAHLQLHFRSSQKDTRTLSQLFIVDAVSAPVIKLYSLFRSTAARSRSDEVKDRVYAQIVQLLSMKCDHCATGVGDCVYRRVTSSHDDVLSIVVLSGTGDSIPAAETAGVLECDGMADNTILATTVGDGGEKYTWRGSLKRDAKKSSGASGSGETSVCGPHKSHSFGKERSNKKAKTALGKQAAAATGRKRPGSKIPLVSSDSDDDYDDLSGHPSLDHGSLGTGLNKAMMHRHQTVQDTKPKGDWDVAHARKSTELYDHFNTCLQIGSYGPPQDVRQHINLHGQSFFGDLMLTVNEATFIKYGSLCVDPAVVGSPGVIRSTFSKVFHLQLSKPGVVPDGVYYWEVASSLMVSGRRTNAPNSRGLGTYTDRFAWVQFDLGLEGIQIKELGMYLKTEDIVAYLKMFEYAVAKDLDSAVTDERVAWVAIALSGRVLPIGVVGFFLSEDQMDWIAKFRCEERCSSREFECAIPLKGHFARSFEKICAIDLEKTYIYSSGLDGKGKGPQVHEEKRTAEKAAIEYNIRANHLGWTKGHLCLPESGIRSGSKSRSVACEDTIAFSGNELLSNGNPIVSHVRDLECHLRRHLGSERGLGSVIYPDVAHDDPNSDLSFGGYWATRQKFNRRAQEKSTCRAQQPSHMRELSKLPGYDVIRNAVLEKCPGMDVLVVDLLWNKFELQGATDFSHHKDTNTEVNKFKLDIRRTVIVKLSHGCSYMEISGYEPLHYDPCAGSFISFRSDCIHRSGVLVPGSDILKLVFLLGERTDIE